jgi:hypothetical protein
MKVRKGTLTDVDRAMIFESNRSGRRLLVHTEHYCALQGHDHGGCGGSDCVVGVVMGWTYESFRLGGWSFNTSVPWESARLVRWRDEVDDDAPCPFETCAFNLRKIAKASAA